MPRKGKEQGNGFSAALTSRHIMLVCAADESIAGQNRMIIDIHGHYTTEPPQLFAFRDKQLAALADPARRPTTTELGISDDELRRSVEPQLKLQRERGSDLTLFSPRASGMAHHVGTEVVSSEWTRLCNNLIHRICTLLPENFAAVGQLPQSPGAAPKNCIPELERIVSELGFVGVNLNPDPSGGYWTGPPLTDRAWYPLYEKLCELDVPAMIHVSSSCNPNFHHTGAHYINADTTAFMQLIQGDLFRDFPTLKFVIPHGGGAVPYHWGRYRGLAQEMKKPLLAEHLLGNVFFDTCVYHLAGMALLAEVIPVQNILFASEMLGAVKGIDPETGRHFDDTKRYVDQLPKLSEADRQKIFEANARRVYPRLDRLLSERDKRPEARRAQMNRKQ
jgi:4-oxalmesaconate hydratase